MAEATGTSDEAQEKEDLEALVEPAEGAAEETADTTAGGEKADTVDGEGKPDPDASKPAEESTPGTPDKALQRLQQDQSAIGRTLEAMLAKMESGAPLTTKEQQKLEQAQRKFDVLKEAIANRTFDLFDNGTDLAEAVLEGGADVDELRQHVVHQAKQLDELRESFVFDRLAEKYEGVDVRALWKTAQAEAAPYARFGEEAMQLRSDELFHSRAAATAKSIKAKKELEAKSGKPALPGKAPTPITPGGAKVTLPKGTPAPTAKVNEDERDMKAYMKLVVTD